MFTGVITGVLGGDATTKEIGSSTALEFSVAVIDVFQKDGTETQWVRCLKYGDTKIKDYLKRGTKVCVSGEIKQRFFTKKDGSAGFALECKVNSIELLSPRDAKNNHEETINTRPSTARTAEPEEDLPF